MKKFLSKKMLMLASCMAMMLAVCSCKKDATEPNNPEPIPCITVEPVKVSDSATVKFLDDIFTVISMHMHWYHDCSPRRYIINSQDELIEFAYEEAKWKIPANTIIIDFAQYTLIGGSFVAIFGGDDIKRVALCENALEQGYTLTEVKPFIEGDVTLGTYPYFYWRLYPKLNPDFAIIYEEVEE